MFTKEQEIRVKEIIKKRDSTPRTYTVEEMSWRYGIWKDNKLVGLKDITGRVRKIFPEAAA